MSERMMRQATGARPQGPGVWWVIALVLVGLAGCSSRYKKLRRGGSAKDFVVHDMLDRDRCPQDYYCLIRSSHREKDFCYECGQSDPFLVDKNIDAVERLGRAGYGRLEGQAEVVELLSEVAMEDRSALARAQAVTSLTQIGVKLPRYGACEITDNGSELLRLMREIDQVYAGQAQRAAGQNRSCPPASRTYLASRFARIGSLRFGAADFAYNRQSLRFFYGRRAIVDEQDPGVRQAIDTALAMRTREVIRVSLIAKVDDSDAQVRQDAVRGLKLMAEASAIEAVVDRIGYETSWLVRMEAVEYLGKVGTRPAVQTLIPLLDDPNASVRHKAQEGLRRIAGTDYGTRRAAWEHWARQKDPTLTFGDDEGASKDDEAGVSLPGM